MYRRRLLFVTALVVSALFALGGVALAQDAPTGTPVVTGLNGPMGVLVDPDGNVWVADSGLGGDTPISVPNPETGEVVTVTIGASSQIVEISAADGVSTTVATVTSYGSPEYGASGAGRIALLDGTLYASVSDWDRGTDPSVDAPEGVATIVEVGSDGTVTEVFDAWAFEKENNPYGAVYHAHPYGLLGGDDGRLWVTEAGGNTLMRVDPATGEGEVVAVMDPLPGVFPRPEYDNQMLTDPVPTGVAIMDGEVYVSLLSGAPFVPGNARVVKVNDDGTVSDFATGLSMLTDLRTGPDGNLYATSFAVAGAEGFGPGSGSVVRIGEGDTSQLIIPGLDFATSLDFDADGNAYVAVNGVGAPGSGQVLRFDGATSLEGTPYADMLAEMAPPPAEADTSAAMTDTAAMTSTSAEESQVMTGTAESSAAPEMAATEATPAAPTSLPVTGSAPTQDASLSAASLVIALLVLIIYMALLRMA